MIRNVNQSFTEEKIREDLEHIHNLVIISVIFRDGNVYLRLNSIHNSLFARTCMMSRAIYKGMKIEWFPDECSEPLPQVFVAPRKDRSAPPLKKQSSSMMNRFHMLNMDGDGAEDGSEKDHDSPVPSDPSLRGGSALLGRTQHSPWNARSIAT